MDFKLHQGRQVGHQEKLIHCTRESSNWRRRQPALTKGRMHSKLLQKFTLLAVKIPLQWRLMIQAFPPSHPNSFLTVKPCCLWSTCLSENCLAVNQEINTTVRVTSTLLTSSGCPMVFRGDVGLCSMCGWERVRRGSMRRKDPSLPKPVEAGFLLKWGSFSCFRWRQLFVKLLSVLPPEHPV